MMNKTTKRILAVLIVLALLGGSGYAAYTYGKQSGFKEGQAQTVCGVDNASLEMLAGGLAWQLSAESNALMEQAFSLATANVEALVSKCNDSENTEWTLETGADGQKRMMHNGVRVAIVSDIDDTLVDGAHYSAEVVGNDGDYNNVSFARFIMSDSCTALPGAVAFINLCVSSGIEVYYVTNRYDQGYKVGQSDSQGSYEASAQADGKGMYCKADGTEIGSTLYQTLGKSIYDISLESMERLGFPVDDQHLIVNDFKLNGSSKEPARSAIREGAEDYPNGQRSDGNSTGSAVTAKIDAHEIVMLLGDNIADFTDDFSASGLDAVSRAELATQYADKWGTEWIVLPNAVYGDSINYATSYGLKELFNVYTYVK